MTEWTHDGEFYTRPLMPGEKFTQAAQPRMWFDSKHAYTLDTETARAYDECVRAIHIAEDHA